MLTSGLLKNPIVLKENIVQTFIDFFFACLCFQGEEDLQTNEKQTRQFKPIMRSNQID